MLGGMGTKRWAWLTAFSLLFAGLTNAHAHVHYCFDGSEPPAAVHLADNGNHHHDLGGDGADGEHDDLDLDLPNQALAKSVKHDLPAIAPIIRWTVGLDRQRTYSTARHDEPALHPPPLYSRPPLRAPPG
jgi:hypothetical protein